MTPDIPYLPVFLMMCASWLVGIAVHFMSRNDGDRPTLYFGVFAMTAFGFLMLLYLCGWTLWHFFAPEAPLQ